jgi:peptidoglycan/LPS O-acetylase OafA/YrhL
LTSVRDGAGHAGGAGHGPGSASGDGPIVGLDIARFLAALSVVIYHYAFFSWHGPIDATGIRAAIGTPVAYPALVPVSWWGWVGVEVFFVISGLVICRSAAHQSLGSFIRNRLLRIAPALWFFATVSFLVTLLYSSARIETVLPMYLRSVVLFPQGPWIDGVYWTLTIEVVFYALISFLIVSNCITRLRAISFAGSMLVAGFYVVVILARAWPGMGFAEPVLAAADAYVSRVVLLSTGAYFLVGANLYLIGRDGWSATGAAALAGSLAAGCVGLWLSAEKSVAVQVHAGSPATPVLIWLVVVAGLGLALAHSRGGRGSGRGSRVPRLAGLASYPLYLLHNVTGAFVFGLLIAAGTGGYPALLIAVALCVAVSVAFAAWVEPALRRSLAGGLAGLNAAAFCRFGQGLRQGMKGEARDSKG